jgi:hypothetical protein
MHLSFFIATLIVIPYIQALLHADGTVCVASLGNGNRADVFRENCQPLAGTRGMLSTATLMKQKFCLLHIQLLT